MVEATLPLKKADESLIADSLATTQLQRLQFVLLAEVSQDLIVDLVIPAKVKVLDVVTLEVKDLQELNFAQKLTITAAERDGLQHGVGLGHRK